MENTLSKAKIKTPIWKNCLRCNSPMLIMSNGQKYCEDCRRLATNEKHKELVHRYKNRNRVARMKTLTEINEEARSKGMSYGNYVAMMGL